MFAASPSRIEEEASAVRPTLSLEWQEDEIRKYLSEPLSFPQPTLPLGYSNPTFHTESNNPQGLQRHSPPNDYAFEVDHTPTTLPPSNGVLISNAVLLLKDVSTFKSDHTTCDLTYSSEVNSIGDLSCVALKANSHLAPTRKEMKVTKDNKQKVLHVNNPDQELSESTQRSQSKGSEIGVDPTNIRLLLVDTLLSSSDVKIQIDNYDIFNGMMDKRRSELEKWKGQKGDKANDARTRVRILKFWRSVTKMSTFLIISHASLLNGQKDREITQSDVKDVLEFMRDFWEKMDRNEALVTSRPGLYTQIPQIPNILDPDDIHIHQDGHKGKLLWYEACEEIAEYWTEQHMNPLWDPATAPIVNLIISI
ncbi:hypothetical protein KEM48_011965 [Puccinia striiformis f. sp. tritici PST-130]|nr:hypothetical protein KEM48_011965 [Puccinia striiformis f. sp. tritici PST-130]